MSDSKATLLAHNGPMDHPESAELLEDRHDFPCPYTFKVIGASGTALEKRVVTCVQESLGLEDPPIASVRTAQGGRHEAITIEPVCPDAEAVLALYAALRTLDDVLFLF